MSTNPLLPAFAFFWLLLSSTGCQVAALEREPEPGTLEGAVKWVGESLPEPTRIQNTTDPQVCGRGHTLEDFLVSPRTGGIAHVIVSLTGVPREKVPPFEPGHLTLDNVDCRFSPHASVLTVGSTIEAVNSDPVLHTTHFYGALEVNVSLPIEGARSARTASQPGLVLVKCDIHGWMQAFIRVDPHPFHAVTDTEGSFQIPGIPAGSYELEIWHEKLGPQSRSVRIEDGKTERVEIEYPLNSN